MIGLGANVLVRYSMQDDPRQSPTATRLIEGLSSERPGFLLRVAIVEALDPLLRSKEIVVDRADLVLQAQRRFATGGADCVDGLLERIAQAHGCQATMTFDARAAKAAGTMLVTSKVRLLERPRTHGPGHRETPGQSDSSRSAGRWKPCPALNVLPCR